MQKINAPGARVQDTSAPPLLYENHTAGTRTSTAVHPEPAQTRFAGPSPGAPALVKPVSPAQSLPPSPQRRRAKPAAAYVTPVAASSWCEETHPHPRRRVPHAPAKDPAPRAVATHSVPGRRALSLLVLAQDPHQVRRLVANHDARFGYSGVVLVQRRQRLTHQQHAGDAGGGGETGHAARERPMGNGRYGPGDHGNGRTSCSGDTRLRWPGAESTGGTHTSTGVGGRGGRSPRGWLVACAAAPDPHPDYNGTAPPDDSDRSSNAPRSLTARFPILSRREAAPSRCGRRASSRPRPCRVARTSREHTKPQRLLQRHEKKGLMATNKQWLEEETRWHRGPECRHTHARRENMSFRWVGATQPPAPLFSPALPRFRVRRGRPRRCHCGKNGKRNWRSTRIHGHGSAGNRSVLPPLRRSKPPAVWIPLSSRRRTSAVPTAGTRAPARATWSRIKLRAQAGDPPGGGNRVGGWIGDTTEDTRRSVTRLRGGLEILAARSSPQPAPPNSYLVLPPHGLSSPGRAGL